MAKEETIVKMGKGFAYFSLSSGGRIHDIVMPGEFRDLTIESVDRTAVADIKLFLEKVGSIQSIEVLFTNQQKNKVKINVTYVTVADAQKAFSALRNKKINVKSRNNTPKLNELSKPLYQLRLTWPRLLSKGTGSIVFSSEENCILVSGKLTTKSFYIEDKYIDIQPSKYNCKVLSLKNIPLSATEKILWDKLSQALPDYLFDMVKDVQVNRFESQVVNDAEILKIKDELMKTFTCFTEISKLMVDIVHPCPISKDWEAAVYFVDAERRAQAYQKLNGFLKLDGISIEIKEIIEAHISYKKNVYEILKKDIKSIIELQKGVLVNVRETSIGTRISFSCQNIDRLINTREKLLDLFEEKTYGDIKHFRLFTKTGQMKLSEIQNATKTHIALDAERKSILIFGDYKSRKKAEEEINNFISKKGAFSNTKTFNLKKSIMPVGFLKQVYLKYGLDLYGLVRDFDLMAASIDRKSGILVIEGQKAKIKQVEEHLETICAELYKKGNKIAQDVDGNCPICLHPVMFDYYRHESCGHAFCKSCLLLQLECKMIPITCAHQDCNKELLLADIERILSFGKKEVKEGFQTAALKYFVSTNVGKVNYCPSPDCPMVYRVSSKSDVEFNCPNCCENICTHCQTYSHEGISCELFQNSKTDDYSLKVWMRENKSYRKQCPNCKVVIEKFDGCNHMECVHCKKDFCWLCLKIFPSGDQVYDHLPFCLNNQSVND